MPNSNAGFLDDISKTVNSVGGLIGSVSQTTSDLSGIINLGDGIVSDFEDMWDTIEGGGVGPDGKFELPDSEQFGEIGANTSARGFILNVLNFFLSFVGIIAVSILIYAGFTYVTSLGDDGKIESAKKMIIYSVIGIIVILMSFALVNTVIKNAGTGGDSREGINGTAEINGTIDLNGLNGINGLTIVNSEQTEAAKQAALAEEFFGFNNGITLSGDGIQDFGKSSVVSPETASKGIDFGLTVEGITQFDFGDNTYGTLDSINNPNATISHSYGQEGAYNIRGITQTTDGKIVPFEKTIVVGGAQAIINASKKSGLVDEALVFDASASSVNAGTIQSYKWSCTGGNGCFAPGEAKIASVSFSEPGNYIVSLIIESTLGMTAETTENISILGSKPTAEFTFASTNNSNKPSEYNFNASNSHNIEGDNSQLTYQWTIEGTQKTELSPTLTYEFLSTGTKTVELEVIQNYNGQNLISEKFSDTVEVKAITPLDFNVTQ